MKKVILLLVVVCNLAIAGGQEGTGSKPEGTTTVDGKYQLVCVAAEDKDGYTTHCTLVKVQTES